MAEKYLVLLLVLFLATAPVESGGNGDADMIEDMMKKMMEDGMGRSMPEGCFTPPDLEDTFLHACRKCRR